MEKKAKKTAITDSGFLYALINQKDPNHQSAKISAGKYDYQWITTCFVFHEVFVLLNNRKPRFPYLIQNLFKMVKTGLLEVINFEKSQFTYLEIITNKYSDRRLDLTDASLILLTETLGHGEIFTIDIDDFTACRWSGDQTFNILIEPTS